jgi:pimeloyl-ACP methyl ester carboxylesterase
MRRLKIGDRVMRLREEGDSRRLPLVFLHGAGSSSVLWMDPVRRLKDVRRVIAPDLPGHGQSDRWHPPSEISIAMYRDAVGTMCAQLGLDRVVLVGHSMGGQVALDCAAAWPERVGGLVLIATGSKIPVDPRVLAALRDDYARFEKWLGTVMWSPSTPSEHIDRWQSLVFSAEQEITAADFRAVDRFDDGEALCAKVKAPTLVLAGADDLATPPSLARSLSSQIAGARLAVVPNAGHMLTLEQSDAFHSALGELLADVA